MDRYVFTQYDARTWCCAILSMGDTIRVEAVESLDAPAVLPAGSTHKGILFELATTFAHGASRL